MLHTALRETKEEVGLRFRPDEIVGHLDAVNTYTSNFSVVPFVTLPKHIPHPQEFTTEVECIINVPLQATLETCQPDFEHSRTSKHDMYRYLYKGVIIWGVTARILKQFDICLRAE